MMPAIQRITGAVLCALLVVPATPSLAAKARPPVAARTVKVALGCGYSTVRDHRGGKTTVATFMDIVNTTSGTLPLGTVVYYIVKKLNAAPFQTYTQLYIVLNPGGKYDLRVADNTWDMDFGCQAWIVQPLERSAAP